MIKQDMKRIHKTSKYIFNVIVSAVIIVNLFAAIKLVSTINDISNQNNNNISTPIKSDIIPNPTFITEDPIRLLSNNDLSSRYTLLSMSSTHEESKSIVEEFVNEEVPQAAAPEPSEEVIVEPVVREPIPKLTKNTDLATPIDITVDEMDAYIAAFGETNLKGYGQYFIDASEATGLNPLYLFGHAALESGFGSSDLAIYKGNYFGIGAYDSDPYNLAYTMGDTMYDGIIQGASWIKESYYDKGQTTLYEMIYGPKCYASAKDDWIWQIASLANSKLSVINDNR